jgi:hypothetical protein
VFLPGHHSEEPIVVFVNAAVVRTNWAFLSERYYNLVVFAADNRVIAFESIVYVFADHTHLGVAGRLDSEL